MTSVFLMFAIMTTSINGQQEVDALAFKSMEGCTKAIEPIRKELLKTVSKVELACQERKVY